MFGAPVSTTNGFVASFFNLTLVSWEKMGSVDSVEDFNGKLGIVFKGLATKTGCTVGLLTDRFKATFTTVVDSADFVTSDFVTSDFNFVARFVIGNFVVLRTRIVDSNDGVSVLRKVVVPVWMRSASGHSSFRT